MAKLAQMAKHSYIFSFEMKRFDPNTVQKIREELDQQQKYVDSIVDLYNQRTESIPYSDKQLEISNEMSNYGSNLIPTLTSCGVFSCLGLSAYLYNKFKRGHEVHHEVHHNDLHNDSYYTPEITNQSTDEIPYTTQDFELQNY